MVAPVLRVAAPRHLSDLLKYEVDPSYVREIATLAANNVVKLGTPLGKKAIGAPTAAIKAGGNTGNGVLTVDGATPILARAQTGVYRVRFVEAGANSGIYLVEDPQGDVVGQGIVGTAFASQIKFAVADGSTDFAVGDGFDITVAAGTGKIVVLDPAAVDGSERCVGLSLFHRDPGASDAPKGVTYLARGPCIVADVGIDWPVGFTAPQRIDATLQLDRLGILVRPSF